MFSLIRWVTCTLHALWMWWFPQSVSIAFSFLLLLLFTNFSILALETCNMAMKIGGLYLAQNLKFKSAASTFSKLLGASLLFFFFLTLFCNCFGFFFVPLCRSSFSSHVHRHLSLLSHSFACVIPAFSHHGFSTTPPHLHLSSVPPPSPPTLFTASLLHPRHPLSPSSYHWLPLPNTAPMLLSFPFPISSLTPSSLPTLPPQLHLFLREYWLANLAVYLQCLVLSRRSGVA